MYSSSLKYRPDVDGLRAIAVSSVVFYHAFPGVLPGGFVGVDIFFVISGFLISSILLRELECGRFSVRTFYERRILRIFPALIFCLFVVGVFGAVALTPVEFAQLGKHVFLGATFLSNVGLWLEVGYFDSASNLKPLLHLWSLGVEEQFYIVWPILLAAIFRFKRKWFAFVFVFFLISFGVNIFQSSQDISTAFYLPFSRLWEFLAGAGLAFLQGGSLSSHAKNIVSWIGLAALLAAILLINSTMKFPGWFAALPVAGATALILSGPDAQANRIVLSNKLAVFVGLISYPLYLWHWPLISFAHVVRMEKPLTPLLSAVLVATSFVLAWVTYRFIENPFRSSFRIPRKVLVLVASMAVIGTLGLVVWKYDGFPSRFPPHANHIDIRKISAAKLDMAYGPTKGMEVTEQHTILTSRIGRSDRKVALAGDSLLMHYAPRAQQLADEGKLSAETYFVTLPSCAPVPQISHNNFNECSHLPTLLAELVKRERVQSVVLGASWAGYVGNRTFVERGSQRFSLDTANGQDAFYLNLEDFVRRLQGEGAKVYLMLGSPMSHRFDPSQMVTRSVFGVQVSPKAEMPLSVAELKTASANVNARLRAVAERTGAELLDPLPDVCGSGNECAPLFSGSEPKFSDGMHLRPVFVRDHMRFLDFLLK